MCFVSFSVPMLLKLLCGSGNMTHGVVDLCSFLFFFFRRGKLDLTPIAYSLHILDENTRSLLWTACSLPYADSDTLQFNFSNLKLNVAPGTSWLKSFSHSGLSCVLKSRFVLVCSAGPLALAELVFFCTVLSKIDGLGIY